MITELTIEQFEKYIGDGKHIPFVGTFRVNPELAKHILDNRYIDVQRKVCKRTVERYSEDMRNGRWMFNGEVMVFDWNGCAINCYHRLNSIVESGTTITTNLQFGIDPKAYATFDDNRKRSRRDAYNGVKGGNEKAHLVEASINVFHLENDNYIGSTVSNIKTVEIVDQYKNELDELYKQYSEFGVGNKTNPVITPAIGLAMFKVCSDIDHEDAYTFFNSFVSGANITNGSPIMLLRNRLVEKKRWINCNY